MCEGTSTWMDFLLEGKAQFVCIKLYWDQVAWTTRLEFSLCTRKTSFQISMLTSTRLILPTDQKPDEPEASASPTLQKSISERSLSSPIENHQSTSTSTPSFERLGVYQIGQNLLGKTPRSVCHICNKKFRNSLQLEIHVKKVSLHVSDDGSFQEISIGTYIYILINHRHMEIILIYARINARYAQHDSKWAEH